MMDTATLRKADIFTGALVLAFGLFMIVEALQMPMTDSYGGVQNVWYVSPALFPLLVGGMLFLLGGMLMRTGLKEVGKEGVRNAIGFLSGPEFRHFVSQPETVRFFGIVINLLAFVFLMVPRVDFFLAAMLFLMVFFAMFYLGDHQHLLRILYLSAAGYSALAACFLTGLAASLNGVLMFSGDWLAILMLLLLTLYLIGFTPADRRKLRLCLAIASLVPLTVGIIFKYFLLVPMPHEGLIVHILDAIRYAEIWS